MRNLSNASFARRSLQVDQIWSSMSKLIFQKWAEYIILVTTVRRKIFYTSSVLRNIWYSAIQKNMSRASSNQLYRQKKAFMWEKRKRSLYKLIKAKSNRWKHSRFSKSKIHQWSYPTISLPRIPLHLIFLSLLRSTLKTKFCM